MTLRGPRRLLHRGVVDARGVALTVGGTAARRRVLALFARGVTVCEVGAVLVVVFAEARRMRCDLAPGTVLMTIDGVLAAAPWRPQELRALGATERHAVLLDGDAAVLVDLAAAPRLDPSNWIDLDGFALASVASLGDPPETLDLPENKAIREVLTGQKPVPRPEWKELVAVLDRRLPDDAAPSQDRFIASAPREAPRSGWMELLGYLIGFTRLLRLLKAADEGRRAASVKLAHTGTRRHWLDRFGEWLDGAFERLKLQKGLHALLGARNALYLEGLIAKLEGGDVDEALLEAIPLGGGSGGDGEQGEIAWRLPQRSSLTIRFGSQGGGPVMLTGESVHDRLKRLYRETAERLAREGRIDQAVFVLAELLRDSREAVELLGRHDRHAMAAELAEAAALDPTIIVREYTLAGRIDDAVRVLRMNSAIAYANALAGLATAPQELRSALTQAWAVHLHATGDRFGAERLIRPLEGTHSLARTWLLEALSLDAPTRAVALSALVERHPEVTEPVLRAAEAMLRRDDEIGRADRLTLAQALTSGPRGTGVVGIARALLPVFVRDGGDTISVDHANATDRLVALIGEASVSADLPPRTLRTAPTVQRVVTTPRERVGERAVYDVIRLIDGRTLAALGEAGIAVFDRAGRLAQTLPVAAHALVAPRCGAVVMALVRRAGVWEVTRVPLEGDGPSAWGSMVLEAFSPDHDGNTWIVAEGARLVALDVLARSPRGLVASRRLGGRVERVVAANTVAAVVRAKRSTELTTGTAPSMTGLLRQPMPEMPSHAVSAITSTGVVGIARALGAADGASLRIVRDAKEFSTIVKQLQGELRAISLADTSVGILCVERDGAVAHVLGSAVLHTANSLPLPLLCSVTLRGARAAGVRSVNGHYVVWDDLGRVVVFEVETRSVRLQGCV